MRVVHFYEIFYLAPGEEQRWSAWGAPDNWFMIWTAHPRVHPNFPPDDNIAVSLTSQATKLGSDASGWTYTYQFTLKALNERRPIRAHVYFAYEVFEEQP